MIRGTGIDSTVKLYLKGNGANGSQKIFDDSQSHRDVTVIGNTKISNAITPKFGTGSIYFDGSGDYITIVSDSSTYLGNSNFFIDFDMYPESVALYSRVFGRINSSATASTGDIVLSFVPPGILLLNFYSGSTDYKVTSNTAITPNQRYHITINKESGVITMYINGVSVGYINVGDVSANTPTTPFTIGRLGDYVNPTYGIYYHGYIENFILAIGSTTDGTKIPTRQRG